MELGTWNLGLVTLAAGGVSLQPLLQPRQALLQLLDALLERFDRLGLWIGQASDGPGAPGSARRPSGPGTPTTVEYGGTEVTTTEPAPTRDPSPISMAPMNWACAPTTTPSREGRVALLAQAAGPAKRHALIEHHVVADLGRLADDDAHAVVDEQALADPRRRVDLDAGQRAVQVGDAGAASAETAAVEACASRWSWRAWKPG